MILLCVSYANYVHLKFYFFECIVAQLSSYISIYFHTCVLIPRKIAQIGHSLPAVARRGRRPSGNAVNDTARYARGR